MKTIHDIPTLKDICPIAEDFDQQYAAKHFLGKNVDEAYEMFCENDIKYIEDFYFMGEKAFSYYVPVLTRALKSKKVVKAELLFALVGLTSCRQQDFWNHPEMMNQFINDFNDSEQAITIGEYDPIETLLQYEETGKAIEKYLIKREKRTDPFEFRL